VTRHTVLVTDGEQRAALALVRALGRAGHKVYVCAHGGRSLAGASRYCRGEARVADPLAEPAAFLADVASELRRRRADVLLPVSEAALLATLPAREQLTGVLLPFADLEAFRRISDKTAVLEAAPRFGIAIPEQRVVSAPGEIGANAADGMRYPLVVKPARSVGGTGHGRVKLAVRHAASPAQLEAALAALDSAAYPALLQQRVVGPGVGIFLLLWDGEVVTRFAHRRIREKPPSGGVSVYRESIPADPVLVERSRALLAHFGWRGVAMVEYKMDAATGTPYLMEINGRFWGSLQLAIDAGVDFPSLLLACADGERPTPVTSYRIGVRSRWWWGDVDQLLTRLRRGRDELALPPDAPGRGRALLDFLALWRPGDRHETLHVDDPRPFIRETINWFARR